MEDLTLKQKRFIDEYLIDFNGTRSAIAAGYSEKTAHAIANELLKQPKIKAAIELSQTKLAKSVQITKEALIEDLLKIKDLCILDPKYVNSSIKSIETINKMLGFNEPDKVENNISLNNFSVKDLVDFDNED